MQQETHHIEHRGCVIFWRTPKPMGHIFPVQISTPNIELRTRLGVDAYITSQVSFEDAIEVAKATIDNLLDGIGPEERTQ